MIAGTLMEQIQHRAYEIWLSEGCPMGRERIHWVRAEAEFRERFAVQNAPCISGLHETPVRDRFGFRRGAQGNHERQLLKSP
jgi:hypothetical protein